MYLEGQHRDGGNERGYAMAALLVAIAVMSVLMAAVLPAWRHQVQREKEAELVFRGEQYVRGIRLWESKMGPGTRPPSFDMMVDQRFLRKKYKDPMTTDGEFQPLIVGVNAPPPAQTAGRGGRGQVGQPGQTGQTGQTGLPGQRGQPAQPQQAQPPQSSIGIQASGGGGGIYGVSSKSKESSIRVYNGATHYNEWRFIHAGAASAPGGGEGSALPGGRGGRATPGGPVGPGGRGPGGRGPGGRGIGPGGRGGGLMPGTFPGGRGGR